MSAPQRFLTVTVLALVMASTASTATDAQSPFMQAETLRPVQTSAQRPDRATVSATTAPLFALPDATRTPVRVATQGSILNVLASEGEWYRVEWDDSQWGRRVGYIEKRLVSQLVAAPQPAVALSVAEPAPPAPIAPEPVAPQVNRFTTSPATSFFPAADTAIGWSVLANDARDYLGLFAFGPPNRISDPTSKLGWMVSDTRNLRSWFGVVGDVGGHYSNSDFGISASTHGFLAGARFMQRPSAGRVSAFGQFLGGFQYTNVRGLGTSASRVNTAIQPGGGVDIRLSEFVAVRLQMDYRIVFHDGYHSGAFRFAPGIVISRGRKAF